MLTDEGRRQLESLLAELDDAIRQGRPARWVVDGNGIDFSGCATLDEQFEGMTSLRDEVRARLEGRMTPTQALGNAIERLNREGWPDA